MKTLCIVLVVINFIAFFMIEPPSSTEQFQNLQMIGSIIAALMISCVSSVVLPIGIMIFRKYSKDRYSDSISETLLSVILMMISVAITYYQVRHFGM